MADITGDDNEDMILYRLAPQAGNNPDYVRREVLATLYTETDGKVTEHETLSVGSADGISFDLDELGLMEVQGQTCLWHNTVGSAYFADGAGQDTEFIGWDGSAFRRLWWVGKSDGGSSEIAYSFRTYSDAENYTQEVLFGDEGYMYTHPGAVTAGAKNYAEAIIMGYQRLGLPDPGVATDPNAHFSAYPGRCLPELLGQRSPGGERPCEDIRRRQLPPAQHRGSRGRPDRAAGEDRGAELRGLFTEILQKMFRGSIDKVTGCHYNGDSLSLCP